MNLGDFEFEILHSARTIRVVLVIKRNLIRGSNNNLGQDSLDKSDRPPSKLGKQQPFFGKPLIFIKLLQACCSVGDQQKAETSEV